MKKLLLSIFALSALAVNAQTFVSTTPENKNIILEEYTGISCGYCPDGHKIGQQLHDANPNDVFLINIHTGGYATPQGPGTDFNTSFGAAIEKHRSESLLFKKDWESKLESHFESDNLLNNFRSTIIRIKDCI